MRQLTAAEIDALPTGSVVMVVFDAGGVYEQRVWQRYGSKPTWDGYERHDWQATDGGFVRKGCSFDILLALRKAYLLYSPEPDTVALPEELDALPNGSVIAMYYEDGSGPSVHVKAADPFEDEGFAWEGVGDDCRTDSRILSEVYTRDDKRFVVLSRGQS